MTTMTLAEGLKAAEELLGQVNVRGKEDCKSMANGIELIQLVRQEIERQEQEAMQYGSGCAKQEQRKPEGDANTV